MKKISKILFFLMIITFYANNIYAEENMIYTVSESTRIAKIFFFLLSISLIVLVLFFSYKIDESEKVDVVEADNDDVIKSVHKPYRNNYTKNNIYENQDTNVLDFNINNIKSNKIEHEDKFQDDKYETKPNVKVEEYKPYENTRLNDMTMVFKTGLLKNTTDNKKYEEDNELKEIEKTIAKANIGKNKRTKKTAVKNK